MSRAVHVVALGARTPLGLDAESTSAAIRAGISRVAEHPFMVDSKGDPLMSGLDPALDPGLLGAERLVEIARTPLRVVLSKLSEAQTFGSPLTCLLGLPETRPGFSDQDASFVAAQLRDAGAPDFPAVSVEPFGRGHAAAIAGLAEAQTRIAQRRCDLCLVGGVDSYLHHETLDWLDSHRQVATADTRSAFHPGEGAAFVALASDSIRRQYNLPSLATLRDTGVALERKLIKTDDDNLGEGLTEAVLAAAAALQLPGELIEDVYCDINGERYRAEEWGFVLLRTSQLFRDGTRYRSPAESWGDMGAASGALFTVLAAEELSRHRSGAAITMVCGGSEGGTRGAALLGAERRS